MKTSRETLAILQEHYPERLAVAVCYNPPWIFAVFWKAISPFIDPNTYRKIRFVNPKREKEVRRRAPLGWRPSGELMDRERNIAKWLPRQR